MNCIAELALIAWSSSNRPPEIKSPKDGITDERRRESTESTKSANSGLQPAKNEHQADDGFPTLRGLGFAP
jgi:hypothetical protein